MIVKCSFCGTQQIVERSAYGSPLITCVSCHKNFITDKIQEPALIKSTPIVEEQPSIWIYLGLLIGALFTGVGLFFSISNSASFIWMAIFGAVFFGAGIYILYYYRREYKKRLKEYEMLCKESSIRLTDIKYQKDLILASKQDKDLLEQLEAFNKQHSVQMNYNDETIMKKTCSEGEELFSRETESSIKLPVCFCKKCGTKLYMDSLYCHKCGQENK